MKNLELKAARVRRGYNQTAVANALGISVTSYSEKERGEREFTEKQKLNLIRFLGLSLQEANDILYNGELPSGIISE